MNSKHLIYMGIQRLKLRKMYNSIVNNFDQKKGWLEQSRYNEAFLLWLDLKSTHVIENISTFRLVAREKTEGNRCLHWPGLHHIYSYFARCRDYSRNLAPISVQYVFSVFLVYIFLYCYYALIQLYKYNNFQ